MKLVIAKVCIDLIGEEYLEFHDGRTGHPFILDMSICKISTKERAIDLEAQFTILYPFPEYRMESMVIIEEESLFELVFAASNFASFTILSD
jgi:hypothetical protein